MSQKPLVACQDCASEISGSAQRCPHCGAVQGSRFDRTVLALFFFFLILWSIGLMVYGVLHLNLATQGVGYIGIAIWMAIIARMFQAGLHKL